MMSKFRTLWPKLSCQNIDFTKYCKNIKQHNYHFNTFTMSYFNNHNIHIVTGMIQYAVDAIKASLDDLPGVPRTYFGKTQIRFLEKLCFTLFLNYDI